MSQKDDLEDLLDDALDDFDAVASASASITSTPKRSNAKQVAGAGKTNVEVKQASSELQEGNGEMLAMMEAAKKLLEELQLNSAEETKADKGKTKSTSSNADEEEFENSALASEFAKQLQSLMAETLEAEKKASKTQTQTPTKVNHGKQSQQKTPSKPSSSASTANVSEKLEQAVNELNENAKNSMDSDMLGDDAQDAFVENLLGQMTDDDKLLPMMETMMESLLTKDVLYQPLKELHEKYPEFLSSGANNAAPEQIALYRQQYECISRLVVEYEKPEGGKFNVILPLMQELQEYGQPPTEIAGEVPNMEGGIPSFPGMPSIPNLPGNQQCNVM